MCKLIGGLGNLDKIFFEKFYYNQMIRLNQGIKI